MSERKWQGEERITKNLIWAIATLLIIIIISIDLMLIAKMSEIKPFVIEIGELNINDEASNMSIHLCGTKIIYNQEVASWESGLPCTPYPILWGSK